VVFRILCNNDRVGGVIGKGGNIVTALQNETGATISIGPKVAGCDERLITVTASEVWHYVSFFIFLFKQWLSCGK
jgi:poly(rC)-binding protein 2/3/4